jgi:hypothetical protein
MATYHISTSILVPKVRASRIPHTCPKKCKGGKQCIHSQGPLQPWNHGVLQTTLNHALSDFGCLAPDIAR